MLQRLLITNYALIHSLDIRFHKGLSTITGETGSGKSILLGALSLVQGKRADKSVMRDPGLKCWVESEWDLTTYGLEDFFAENDLDYDRQCIIRREISPSGKSRAFVNDTPVSLGTLSELTANLIDIHSQHQANRILDPVFQLSLLDDWSHNGPLLAEYRVVFDTYRAYQSEWQELSDNQMILAKELDYHQFLLRELDEARLDDLDLDQLEQERDEYLHSERIDEVLAEMGALALEEEQGVLARFRRLLRLAEELSSYSERFNGLKDRIQSVFLEFEDLGMGLDAFSESIELDPTRLQELQDRLEGIYRLQNKHQINDLKGLVTLREELRTKVVGVEHSQDRINELDSLIEESSKGLRLLSEELHEARKAAIPRLVERMQTDLSRLGMPKARVEIELRTTEDYTSSGTDRAEILFSANPGQEPRSLKKVASGGEMSRIMLVLKAIMAQRKELPTLIFDEIDTGVSGEVSEQMGRIMKEMGEGMQVISITHIPQIAAKGVHHYKVYKQLMEDHTETRIELLDKDQRIAEIAEMLSGKNAGRTAWVHAEELLRA